MGQKPKKRKRKDPYKRVERKITIEVTQVFQVTKFVQVVQAEPSKDKEKKPPRFKWLSETFKGVAIPSGGAVVNYLLNHQHDIWQRLVQLWHHFF